MSPEGSPEVRNPAVASPLEATAYVLPGLRLTVPLAGLYLLRQRIEPSIELALAVEGGDRRMAPLVALRIEAVPLQDPPVSRVVARIDFRHSPSVT
jgi:hypothetical protein